MSFPDPAARPLLTVDELLECVELPMSRATLYRAIDDGQLPSLSVGRKKYLITAQLRQLLGLTPDRLSAAGPGPESEELPASMGSSSKPDPSKDQADANLHDHPRFGREPQPAA